MISFREFFVDQLNEKLITFNHGKKYGQVVFMAGGAGSGKGFAIKNFIDGHLFKQRDVDAWKQAFLKLSKIKDKYSELSDMDLKNPNDVYQLHKFVSDLGIKDKTLNLLLQDLNTKHLPNILFDITLKDAQDLKNIVPKLIEEGYDPKNIHVCWVLTDYSVAVQNNFNRSRMVPSDILLKTHEGAAGTMYDFIKKGFPKEIDGKVAVILNNPEHTISYTKDAKVIDKDGKRDTDVGKGETFKGGQFGDKKNMVVKDFKYLTLKKEGKKFETEEAVMKQLISWIQNNIPKTSATSHVWDD